MEQAAIGGMEPAPKTNPLRLQGDYIKVGRNRLEGKGGRYLAAGS